MHTFLQNFRAAVYFAAPFFLSFFLSSCIYYSGPYDGEWSGWGGSRLRGSGNLVTEIRPVSGIRTVHLDNQGDMSIILGETESLIVDAEDNLQPYIITEVRGGELHIYNEDRRYFRNREPIHYTLTVRSLEGLETGSTGSIEAPALNAGRFSVRVTSTGSVVMDSLAADEVEIGISSAGSVRVGQLEAQSLDVRISSTGNANIRRGNVTRQDVRISSTGNYEAMNVDSDLAFVRLNSTGSAYLSVNDYLEATLNSTGSVHYRGDATTDIRRNSVGRAVFVSRR